MENKPQIYFDNAATTPIRPKVAADMYQSILNEYGNPSSTHSLGQEARKVIEKTRKSIAETLNSRPSEIVFTSGGTEANNMILRCAVKDLGVRIIITSKIEHHAVLNTCNILKEESGIKLYFVDLTKDGSPDLNHLEALLQFDTTKKLVSLMHVNNEIGNILDVKKVGALCKKHEALFHSDTVQSIGHFVVDPKENHIDFLTAAAHKFHGPKGVGFAYVKAGLNIKSMITGGSQERERRAGTEAVHNIVGLRTAFELAYLHIDTERSYILGLKQYFIAQLREKIPAVAFNGLSNEAEKSTYTLVNVRLPLDEKKALMVLFHLNLNGICCSKGSACQAGNNGTSHVLNQILTTDELKRPSIRFSFSKYNTKEEIDTTIGILENFVMG